MIDLTKETAAEELHNLFYKLHEEQHKDISRTYYNADHYRSHGGPYKEAWKYSCTIEGIKIVVEKRIMKKFRGKLTFVSNICIASIPGTKLIFGRENPVMKVWDEKDGWIAKGPWEEKIVALLVKLEADLEQLKEEIAIGSAAKKQFFVDNWS